MSLFFTLSLFPPTAAMLNHMCARILSLSIKAVVLLYLILSTLFLPNSREPLAYLVHMLFHPVMCSWSSQHLRLEHFCYSMSVHSVHIACNSFVRSLFYILRALVQTGSQALMDVNSMSCRTSEKVKGIGLLIELLLQSSLCLKSCLSRLTQPLCRHSRRQFAVVPLNHTLRSCLPYTLVPYAVLVRWAMLTLVTQSVSSQNLQ